MSSFGELAVVAILAGTEESRWASNCAYVERPN
jgi:hypothetical protein